MKKRILSAFVVCCMLITLIPLMPIPANAVASELFREGNWVIGVEDYNPYEYLIIGYTGTDGDVTIPEKVGPYTVHGIHKLAFTGNTTMKTLTIPDGLTVYGLGGCDVETVIFGNNISFGSGVFKGCKYLGDVTLPSDMTVLPSSLFEGCESLYSVALPAGLETIGQEAFKDCVSLAHIFIPEGVTIIESGAFSGCTALTFVQFPEGIEKIGGTAFEYCTGLTEVYIPKNVNNIGRGAFDYCENIEKFTVDEANERFSAVDGHLCEYWESRGKLYLIRGRSVGYDGVYTIPGEVNAIDSSAFTGAVGLTGLYVPQKVESIADRAFIGCLNLQEVWLEDYIRIGYHAFDSVTATVYYPSNHPSFTEEYRNDEDYGGTLTWVSYDPMAEFASGTCGDNISWVLTLGGTLIVSGEGDVPDLHNEGYPWKEYAERIKKVIFEEGVTNVPDSAFNYYYPNLESVELKSVEIIDYTAFTQCYQLKSVSLPDTLKEIRGGAFSCTALSSVDFPESLISIGGSAFSDTDLTSVVLHEGLETIGANAFNGCDSLKSVVLPDSVTDMDMGVFMGCTSLETVNIPKGVTILHMSLFSGCTSLKSIVIPEGVEMLDMCVFSYSGLTSVTFSGSVKQIYNPFENCQLLEEVIFTGDAPEFVYYSFRGLTLTAYYPANNATWTEDVLQNYSGDITWVAVGPEVEFVGASLSLKGDIGLNFYAEVSQKLLADTGAYMKFTGSGAARYLAMADGILDESDGSYRYSVALNAKNMGDNVTAQVYNATGAVGDSSTLSIKYYADYVINNSEKEVFVNLMKAMLNYGAAAQVEFGYDTENLVNADMTEADRTLPETLDVAKYAHTWSGEEDGIEVTNASLLLQSETKIRIYFKLAEGKSLEDFNFTIDGVEVTPVQSGDEYYIEKTNVAAKDLDTMYTFCLGNRQLTYCGLSYVNQVLGYSSDADLLNLVKALYVYNQAANAYFAA